MSQTMGSESDGQIITQGQKSMSCLQERAVADGGNSFATLLADLERAASGAEN